MTPKEATYNAMEEVSGPVIGIALILASVFIQVAFTPGIQGRLNKPFAVTIAVSVLISAFNRGFLRVTNGYVGVSRLMIRRMILTLAVLAGFTVFAGWFGTSIPKSFLPMEDQSYFFLNVQLPDAASLERTNVVTKRAEAILGGASINQFNRFGRQWRVDLQAEGDARVDAGHIGTFYVKNDTGEMVPLSALTTVRKIAGPEYTNRFNLFRAVQVTGQPAPGYNLGQAMDALEEVAREVLPRGMGFEWADLSYQEKHAGSAAPIFARSIVLVFLILAGMYESWSLPFSVLLSVSVAVFGAFGGLLLRK